MGPGKIQWCAQLSLQKYGELPEALHHPLSRLFLSPTDPCSFRPSIERLAAGTTVKDLPDVVRIFIARMRFWSVLETPTEEEHARLSRTINRKTHWSGSLVSLALRLPAFIRETEEEPELYRMLVEHFEAALGHGAHFVLRSLNPF